MTDVLRGLLQKGVAPQNIPGLPIFNITSQPQQLPVTTGVTLLNSGTQIISLSTDAIPTAANTIMLAINGALPIPANSGPLWASVPSGTPQGQVAILNKEYNITNPLVQVQASNVVQVYSNPALAVPGTIGVWQIGTPPSFQFTPQQQFQALYIALTMSSAQSLPWCATVNPFTGLPSAGYTGAFMTGPLSGGLDWVLQLPYTASVGSPTTVTLYGANNAGGSFTANVKVWGLVQANPIGLRGDGRIHPVGRFAQGLFQSAAGTYTVVSANSPNRVLIKTLSIRGQTNFIDAIATLSGLATQILSVANGGGQAFYADDEGILLDVGTPLQFATGGTGGLDVVYDIVV